MTKTASTAAVKTAGKQRGRQFKPGASGNPDGKPRGARHRVTRAVEELLEGDAEKLTRKAIDLALAGDSTALRLCLERIAPAPKDRTIAFDLPAVSGAADAAATLAALIQAVANGELSPAEAANMAALVDRWRAAFETTELDRRLRALEEKAK